MKIKSIPDLSGLRVEITSLSPSTYYYVKDGCSFPSVINIACRKGRFDSSVLLPNSPASIRGTIIHKLLEERVKGLIQTEEQYELHWRDLTRQYEEETKLKYPSLRNFIVNDLDKMYESCDSAMEITPVTNYRGDTNEVRIRTVEVPVSIPGVTRGIVDRIKFHNNEIEIIDYKSGEVMEDGAIKESYVYQLNLYALCCEQTFEYRVKKLTLIQTSDNKEFDVPLERDKFIGSLADIKSIIEKINTRVQEGQMPALQVLSERQCSYCRCRHFCNKYLNSEIKSEYIVDGYVTDSSNPHFISLRDNNGNSFSVSKLSDMNIEDATSLVNRHLVFVNVSSRIDNVYKRTDKTLIFELPT